MKKYLLYVISILLLAGTTSSSLAAPIGNSAYGRDYLVAGHNLHGFNFGTYITLGSRRVSINNTEGTLDSELISAYLGYDIMPWATIYGLGGSGHLDHENVTTDESMSQYGFGISVNILDHMILDPTLFEDRIKISAQFQYTALNTDLVPNTKLLSETYGCMTIAIVNDSDEGKLYCPNGISVYGGPAISTLNSGNISAKKRTGVCFGMEVFLTELTALNLRMDMFGKTSVSAGLNIRF
ncbi:hypothetical protein ACFLS1_01570 [Verrucomicrobiota bacterium]